MSVEVKAAGLIICRRLANDNAFEYLLLRHAYGKRHWTPPKGHVDPGETDISAAIRETQEESGIGPSDYSFIEGFKHTLFYKARGKNKAVDYWLAKVKDINCSVKLSREHDDFKWLSVEEACHLVEHEGTESLLIAADNFLQRKE